MAIAINGSGTITGVSVGGLPDGIVDTDMIATSAVTGAKIGSLPAGSVLQVVQDIKTDTFTTTSSAWTNVTGLSATITPSSADNKILILAAVTISPGFYAYGRMARGSTGLHVGDSATNYIQCTFGGYGGGSSEGEHQFGTWTHPINYLDSPATTSAVTYNYQVRTNGSGHSVYVNRPNNPYLSNAGAGASSIILMEIGA